MDLPIPTDPPATAWIQTACQAMGSQVAAARALHVDGRTMRRWLAGDSRMPWHAAELLRRIIDDRV